MAAALVPAHTPTLTPRPDQLDDVAAILDEPSRGALVASVTGAGKSLVGVRVAIVAAPKQLLVVAPINTQDSWTWTFKDQVGTDVLRVCTGISGTSQGYANLQDLQRGKPGWYFIGWEMLSQTEYWKLTRLDGLIADEIHRGVNPSRIRSRGAYAHMLRTLGRQVAKNDGIRLGFSATPAGNRMENLFVAIEALWPKRSGPRSYWDWANKHFYTGVAIVNQAGTQVRQVGVEKRPGRIVRKLPLYIRHEARTACCVFHPDGIQADLPERVVHRVGVDLSPQQRRVYDQMEQDMLAWIDDNDWPIMAQGYPMVKSLRLHQICLAQPTTNLATRLLADQMTQQQYIQVRYALDCVSSKIDALKDIIADIPADEPVLVLTHSAGIIPAVAHQLRKSLRAAGTNRGRKQAVTSSADLVAEWHGSIPHGERQKVKERFLRGETRIIVAQIDAIAEGTDGLQRVCSNEIWLSQSNSGMSNVQALGRLQRDGQTRTVNSWQIYARGTLELAQYARLGQNDRVLQSGLRAVRVR